MRKMCTEETDSLALEFVHQGNRTGFIGWYCEPNLPIYYVNDEMIKLLGYSNEKELVEAIDGKVVNVIHPDDIGQVTMEVLDPGSEGGIRETSYRMLRKDGSWFWVESKEKLIRGEDGRWAVLGFCMDMSQFVNRQKNLESGYIESVIHESRLREKELKHRQYITDLRLQTISNAIHGGFIVGKFDKNHTFIRVSQQFSDMLGYDSPEELIRMSGGSMLGLVNVEESSSEMLQALQTLRSGNMYTMHYRLRCKDGSWKSIEEKGNLIKNDAGEDELWSFVMDQDELAKKSEALDEIRREKHILDTLCTDYAAFFFLDFDRKKIAIVKDNPDMYVSGGTYWREVDFDFYAYNLERCFDNFIDKDVFPDFEEKLNLGYIKSVLKKNGRFTYRFSTLGEKKHHIEMYAARTDGIESAAVMGFRIIDDIIAQEQQKKRTLQEVNERLELQLNTIWGLSNAYIAVYWVDLRSRAYRALKNIPLFEKAVQKCHTIENVVNEFNKLCVMPEDQEKMRRFTDWHKLGELLAKSDSIVEEFHGTVSKWEWCRASWIAASRDEQGAVSSVLFAVEDISSSVAERKHHEEEHLLLQEKDRVISGLSQEYTTVWLITGHDHDTVKYQDTGRDNIVKESVVFAEQERKYEPAIIDYAQHYVLEADRAEFIRKTRYEEVQKQIRMQPVYSVIYRRVYKGRTEYFQVCFVLADRCGVSDDFVMGYKNVDDVVLADEQKSAALSAALKEAERASRAKSDFLSRMSHDIRTPLNGIIGLLKINEDHFDDQELVKSNFNKMKISADHLLSLINDILQMSKIEDGNVILSRELVDLDKMAGDIRMIIEERASERGIKMEFARADHVEPCRYVYGSTLHLRQIFLNIYGNCIKYNKVGGTITTLADCCKNDSDENRCEFRWTISDTGIGMSDDFIKSIYEPFVQEKDDARSMYNGVGLGMAIVKGLLEQMGGSIEVSSTEGVGSTFVITIPFEKASDAEKEQENISAKNDDISGMHLLIVEDNNLNMEIAQMMLTDQGAEVTAAGDGQQAVELFSSSPEETYDAILMDVMMPVMNGITATQTIRALDRQDAKSIPIIAMTANAFKEDEEKCLAAGMNAHIPKPLNMEKVRKTICELCDKR